MSCHRNNSVLLSPMEIDIYLGFTALQKRGHDSGVLLFVDEGESYSVVGKVFDRALQDNEEKNAIVRAIIEQQNSVPYGADTFFSVGNEPCTYVHYKNTLLILDLARSFEEQWPFRDSTWSPHALRISLYDNVSSIFPGLDLQGPQRRQAVGGEIIPPEPYGRVDVQDVSFFFAAGETHLSYDKVQRIDIYALKEGANARDGNLLRLTQE